MSEEIDVDDDSKKEDYPDSITVSIPYDIHIRLKLLKNARAVVSYIISSLPAEELRRYKSMKKGDEKRRGKNQLKKAKFKPKRFDVTEEAGHVYREIPERFRSLMFRERFNRTVWQNFMDRGWTKDFYWPD